MAIPLPACDLGVSSCLFPIRAATPTCGWWIGHPRQLSTDEPSGALNSVLANGNSSVYLHRAESMSVRAGSSQRDRLSDRIWVGSAAAGTRWRSGSASCAFAAGPTGLCESEAAGSPDPLACTMLGRQ